MVILAASLNGRGSQVADWQMKIDQKTDESVESTRRMKTLCEESKDAAIQTMVALDDQGDRLIRVEEGLNQINRDMKVAESNLNEMEKCCGICVCPCKKTLRFKSDDKTWKSNEDGKVVNSQPVRVVVDSNVLGPTGGFVAKVTNDAREDEMEENLRYVHETIGNLRNMALDIGSEIASQDPTIERIKIKSESNIGRINSANQQASHLLKE